MKQYSCPFSGEPVRFEPRGGGTLVQIVSPYGWRSKIFRNKAGAGLWMRNMPKRLDKIEREVLDDRRRFRVKGSGWYSQLFQTEEGMEFWLNHRDGQKIEGTPDLPAPITATERRPPEEDPGHDYRDLMGEMESAAAEDIERAIHDAKVQTT